MYRQLHWLNTLPYSPLHVLQCVDSLRDDFFWIVSPKKQVNKQYKKLLWEMLSMWSPYNPHAHAVCQPSSHVLCNMEKTGINSELWQVQGLCHSWVCIQYKLQCMNHYWIRIWRMPMCLTSGWNTSLGWHSATKQLILTIQMRYRLLHSRYCV